MRAGPGELGISAAEPRPLRPAIGFASSQQTLLAHWLRSVSLRFRLQRAMQRGGTKLARSAMGGRRRPRKDLRSGCCDLCRRAEIVVSPGAGRRYKTEMTSNA